MTAGTLERPTTSPDDLDAVIAHEVGHLLVAWHFHAPVASISVVPEVVNRRVSLGKVDADLSRLEPREQAMVALAGPFNAFLLGHDVGPGSVDDFLRVRRCGYHHQDKSLARDTQRILDLHREVATVLDYYLAEHGTLSAAFVDVQRYQVEDAALASLIVDDTDARRYQRHDGAGTLTDSQLVEIAGDVEPLLTALRTAWRRKAADDWFGKWRIEDCAASLKAAAEAQRPVVRRRKAGVT